MLYKSGTPDTVQSEISTWAEQTFPHHTALSIAKHLLAESMELLVACGGTVREAKLIVSGVNIEKQRSVDEEAADVNILVNTLAGYERFSLAEATYAKMLVNREREWDTGANVFGFHEHKRSE